MSQARYELCLSIHILYDFNITVMFYNVFWVLCYLVLFVLWYLSSHVYMCTLHASRFVMSLRGLNKVFLHGAPEDAPGRRRYSGCTRRPTWGSPRSRRSARRPAARSRSGCADCCRRRLRGPSRRWYARSPGANRASWGCARSWSRRYPVSPEGCRCVLWLRTPRWQLK